MNQEAFVFGILFFFVGVALLIDSKIRDNYMGLMVGFMVLLFGIALAGVGVTDTKEAGRS